MSCMQIILGSFMMRAVNWFVIFFFFCFASGIAQHIKPESLFGKWRVKDWLFFENLHETPEEHAERMREYSLCLKAKITIDSIGIRVENNSCSLDPCNYNFSKSPKYYEKRIVSDNNYTRREQGSEMIDSNIVGKRFVQYLDPHYSKSTLLLLDAGCTQSYGDFTMKICIVSRRRIGLFLGEELIILQREN